MQLILIRHAEAEERREDQPDEDRELTGKGAKQAKRIAELLDDLDLHLDLLLTSPLRRALQTAEPLEDNSDRLEVEPRLAGSPDEGLVEKLRALGAPGARVALVGHEPYLGELCSLLLLGSTGSAERFALAKGGVTVLEWPDPGCISVVLTPKLIKRLT